MDLTKTILDNAEYKKYLFLQKSINNLLNNFEYQNIKFGNIYIQYGKIYKIIKYEITDNSYGKIHVLDDVNNIHRFDYIHKYNFGKELTFDIILEALNKKYGYIFDVYNIRFDTLDNISDKKFIFCEFGKFDLRFDIGAVGFELFENNNTLIYDLLTIFELEQKEFNEFVENNLN